MIQFVFACNHWRSGTPMGKFSHAEFHRHAPGEDVFLLELELDETAVNLVVRKDGDRETRLLRVGRITVPIHGYNTWVGNWCWDAAAVDYDAAEKIIAYLRDHRHAHNIGGLCSIPNDLRVTAQQLQEAA